MAHLGERKQKKLFSTQLIILAGAVLTAGWLLLPVNLDLGGRPFAAVCALLLWPTLAWSMFYRLWSIKDWSGEAALLSFAGSLAFLLAAILIFTNLGLALSAPLLALLILFFTVIPFIFNFYSRHSAQKTSLKIAENWFWFLLPLAVALILRLPWFGYREIQGDEGIVLVRAADALLGDAAELLLHRKGPMEILLSMGVWGAAGKINDFWVRLPFLISNLVSLALFFRLADRWFSRKVALLASCLLAIVGFHVAFSRVVQYQSLVMMWGIGALLAAERYRKMGRLPDLLLTAILIAAGLLSHYDAVLFVPTIMVLLIAHWSDTKRIPIGQVGLAGAIGLLMLGLFYIPFLFGPDFENAIGYLLNERVDTSAGGNFADVWQMVTFYNSSWAIIGFVGFALAGLFKLYQHDQPMWVKIAAVSFLLVPLLFYTVVVSVPRTHVYTFFPGLALVAALGIDMIAELRRPNVWLNRLGWVGFATWFLICASYTFILFTWGPGEVQRNWDNRRPNSVLYWTTWNEPPLFGLFGFPYQAGWREVGRDDFSNWVYASNEESEITNWYLAQATRTHCDDATVFFLAKNVQDEISFNSAILNDKSELSVSDQLTIFTPNHFSLSNSSRMVTPAEVSKSTYGGTQSLNADFGEGVTLLGYDLTIENDGVLVVLYWQVNQSFDRNFQAFVHAVDADGILVAQHDSAPECGVNPTTRWEPGSVIRDPHKILWQGEGEIRLMVGMYDLITQERLPVAGEPGNFVNLRSLTILNGLLDEADAEK